jgi:redox-sensing transcriptional repressor
LTSYNAFAAQGFEIKAAFDVDNRLIGQQLGVTDVRDFAEMEDYLMENPIDIGIVATPKDVAQSVSEKLVNCGVKAIWNYAPIDVCVEGAIVENVHLSDSLYVLSFRLNSYRTKESTE